MNLALSQAHCSQSVTGTPTLPRRRLRLPVGNRPRDGQTSRTHRIPWPVALLLIYLAAITIVGKGPTYLGYPPFYWGELVVALSLVWCLRRGDVTGFRFKRLKPLTLAIWAYILLGAVRTVVSLPDWGIDAIRDAAIWYYALMYFVGLNLGAQHWMADRIWKLLCVFWLAALLWHSLDLLLGNALSQAGPMIPWRQVPLLFASHHELVQHLALGALIVLLRLGPWRSPGLNVVFSLCAVIGLILAISAHGRGVKVGLLAGTCAVLPLVFAGGRKPKMPVRLLCWLSAACLLLTVCAAVTQIDILQFTSLDRFRGVLPSNQDGTTYWRVLWWRNLFNEVIAFNPLFGLGFGESLRAYNPFLVGNEYEDWPLRAPHNFNVTIFARMGAAGLACWIAILFTGMGGLFRRVWAGGRAPWRWPPRRREELVFWLFMIVTTWINSSFGVLMEGPVLGIWFWFALGFASSRSAAARSPRLSFGRLKRRIGFPPIQPLPERAVLGL